MGHAPAGRRSFTLVETLVTLALLIVLATLIVPAMASLKWEAATDRAQAEVIAALSDARSLARARSCPVVVTLRRSPEGTAELWGSAVDPAEMQAAVPDGRQGDQAAGDAPSEVSWPAARAGRRFAILPERCTLAARPTDPALPADDANAPARPPAANPADSAARPGGEADLPESLQLAVVFPDGTALVPATPMMLTVPRGPGAPDRVFRLSVNPWFAEAAFTEVLPPSPAEPAEARDEKPALPAGEAAP
jgi:type II secretory pathway pseudopilin PulG